MAPIAIDDSTEQSQFHQCISDLSKNPLERTWRGNEANTLRIDGYPDFMHATDEEGLMKKRRWVQEHLAIAFRFWGKLGYGEGISGHITVRVSVVKVRACQTDAQDPILRDHFWMNPFGVHFSSMTISKLVLVTPQGYVHPTLGAQLPINVSGLYSNTEMCSTSRWRAFTSTRPFIMHAQKSKPPLIATRFMAKLGQLLVDLSRSQPRILVCSTTISPYTKTSAELYVADRYFLAEALVVAHGQVLAAEEGASIAKALGPRNKCCILQNHGLLTLGHTVDEAVYLFSALDKQCKVQLMIEAAAANGLVKTLIDDEDARFTANTIQ